MYGVWYCLILSSTDLDQVSSPQLTPAPLFSRLTVQELLDGLGITPPQPQHLLGSTPNNQPHSNHTALHSAQRSSALATNQTSPACQDIVCNDPLGREGDVQGENPEKRRAEEASPDAAECHTETRRLLREIQQQVGRGGWGQSLYPRMFRG